MGIRPEQLDTAAAITSLLNAADAPAARAVLGVPSLAGDAFTGPVSLPGAVFGVNKAHSSGAEANYKLATLKASSDGGSNSRMLIAGVLDDTWFSNGQTPFQLFIATRSVLTAQMVWYGAARTTARIQVYLEADNTYTVWLRFPVSSYASAGLMINAGSSWTAYLDTPTGTPTGTLVYDSGDTATYPPVAMLNFASDMRAFLACTNDAAARAELGLGALATKSTVGYAEVAASVGGRNLLPNSSFELGLTGWTSSGLSSIAPSATQKIAGSQSLKLVASTDTAYALATVTVRPSTTYTVSAWLYVESITAGATGGRDVLVQDASDVSNYAVGSSLVISHPVGGWTRKIVRITTTAACTSLNIRLYCPTGVVHWDCVQVEEGDMPTAWSPADNEDTTLVADTTTRSAPVSGTAWIELEEGMGEGFISLSGPGYVGTSYEQNARVRARIGGVDYYATMEKM